MPKIISYTINLEESELRNMSADTLLLGLIHWLDFYLGEYTIEMDEMEVEENEDGEEVN